MTNDFPTPPEWPAHFPAGCPPAKAESTEGTIFRFVKSAPPSPSDMLSWLELQVPRPDIPECQRAAISVFRELEDAQELQRLVPKFKTHLISKGKFTPDDGKIMRTTKTRGHYSLWLRRAVLARAHERFTVGGV